MRTLWQILVWILVLATLLFGFVMSPIAAQQPDLQLIQLISTTPEELLVMGLAPSLSPLPQFGIYTLANGNLELLDPTISHASLSDDGNYLLTAKATLDSFVIEMMNRETGEIITIANNLLPDTIFNHQDGLYQMQYGAGHFWFVTWFMTEGPVAMSDQKEGTSNQYFILWRLDPKQPQDVTQVFGGINLMQMWVIDDENLIVSYLDTFSLRTSPDEPASEYYIALQYNLLTGSVPLVQSPVPGTFARIGDEMHLLPYDELTYQAITYSSLLDQDDGTLYYFQGELRDGVYNLSLYSTRDADGEQTPLLDLTVNNLFGLDLTATPEGELFLTFDGTLYEIIDGNVVELPINIVSPQ